MSAGTMPHAIAIDMGGTKIAAAVADTTGALLSAGRVPTPQVQDSEVIYDALVDLCRSVVEQAAVGPCDAIGVGCAGPMLYPEGIVSPLNAPAWRDFPLRDRLTETFGLPTIVDNDAKTMALGEQWLGAGRGVSTMLGMVVSTGVGGGLIADGRLIHGAHGNAGHIGHVVVWANGPACACGGRGCLEAIASGTAIARRLGWAQDEGAETSLPRSAQAPAIADAARAGDPLAARLFHEAGEAVGIALASSAALADLELVALGGSVSLKAWDLINPPLEQALRTHARLFFTRDLRVVQATLGDRAGLLGAAKIAFALLGGEY